VATATPSPSAAHIVAPRTEASVDARRIEPVVWWAILGGLILAGVAYIMIRWITGPYFEPVDPGPTEVAKPQEIALLVIQIGGTALAIWCLWHFLVKPWRRDGKPTSEGLLAVAYGTLYVQDPVSLAGGYWFTYNATMFDMGSWAPYLPFFNAPSGEPGNMLAEPIFGMGSGYVYFWIIGVWAAFACFKFAMKRFPRLGLVGGLAFSYVGAVLFDVILEGFIWMRTGFYSYPGAPGPKIDEGSFMAYPIVEGLLIGLLLTPYAVLRYYRDDRGLTIVERGVDNLRVGSKTKVLLRFLALTAVAHCIYFFCYNIYAYHIGVNQVNWPEDTMEKSYLLNGVCGEPNNRACYGPGNPNNRENSGYLDSNGKFVMPTKDKLPATVPVVVGKE